MITVVPLLLCHVFLKKNVWTAFWQFSFAPTLAMVNWSFWAQGIVQICGLSLWEVAWSTMGEKLWMQLGAIKVRLNYDLEAIPGFKRMSLLSTSLNPVSTSNLLTILGWETPYKWATDLGLWGHLLKGINIVNTDFFLRTWINWVLC